MGVLNNMKIRIQAAITVILLIITSISVIAVDSDDDHKILTFIKEDHFLFSQAIIETKETYVSVNLAEANTFLMQPGKPMLPVCTKTFTFPLGTKIKSVICTTMDISEMKISGKIKPAPRALPKITVKKTTLEDTKEETLEDSSVYSNSDLYPNTWYDYSIRCGRKDDQSVIRVMVRYYPLRYSPMENIIYQTEGVDVKITYEKPLQTVDSDSDYDMVIIAPRGFSLRLQPLINHKNKMGMKTTLKTTESVYTEAGQGIYGSTGRDRAEKIKLFIYWAKENWDIKYVLLVGGRQRQTFRWHVPVRYSNLDDEPWGDPNWETSYLSDLYFADIYRYNETKMDYEFEDWDSNYNNVFAEWTFKWVYNETYDYWKPVVDKKDVLDLDPDVYVGRLACRDKSEVSTVVNKVINYEKNLCDPSWFKRMILVGGDTFPGDNDPYYEGERETDFAASFMKPLGFTLKELWTSNGNFNGVRDVIKAINRGAGFIFFAGHGSPRDWGTHPPNSDYATWVDGLYTSNMKWLWNGRKLPIVVVGGCHNSQFDVTMLNMLKGIKEYGRQYFSWNQTRDCFWKWEWIPRCWSWNLVRQKHGGSIATIGNTGLGWGVPGSNSMNYQDGYITTHFFQVYASLSGKGNHSLGEIHSQTISDYIEVFPTNNDPKDRKTVEEWVLLGDPSLRIGGYPQ